MTGPWASRLLATRPRQPNPSSCGAACLVMARALTDERYAELLVTGRHPTTGYRLTEDPPARFADEVRRMHRRITSLADLRGRPQPPWWRRLGTPPWAVARQLSAGGVRHRVHRGGARVVPGLLSALQSGPVPLYVGTRWMPRHVVLAVGPSPADSATGPGPTSVICYEPTSGRLIPVPITDLVDRRCPLAGWSRWWWAVLPDPR